MKLRRQSILILLNIKMPASIGSSTLISERNGSVVEYLTRDRRVAGSSLTGVTALWQDTHIYPSLVLVQPRKTRPCLIERLLMGRKRIKSNKQINTYPQKTNTC